MTNEKLTKKLAIFHHPLFQNICTKWFAFLVPGQKSLNLATFVELNIRIQKAIMVEFNFENAFLSALNDWLQEVESLSSQRQASPQKGACSKSKMENDRIKLFMAMQKELPFETTTSNEDYIDVLYHTKHHEAFEFINDHISLNGFAKFLFDLCYSWCEELDIELFSIFINGVLIEVSTIDPQGKLCLKKSDSIQGLSDTFMTQHKLLKVHYNRYKKIDLSDYESWYEWNYLTARINEMKVKAREIFVNSFQNYETLHIYLEELYNDTTTQIVQKGLEMPTSRHFTFYSLKAESDKTDILSAPKYKVVDPEAQFVNNTYVKPSINAHKRVLKKLAMPVIGKTIPKPPPPEQNIHTHTIKSLSTFLYSNEQGNLSEADDIDNVQGLCPIWENEISETNSYDTLANFYHYDGSGKNNNRSQSPMKIRTNTSPYSDIANITMNLQGKKDQSRDSTRKNEESYSRYITSHNKQNSSILRPTFLKQPYNLTGYEEIETEEYKKNLDSLLNEGNSFLNESKGRNSKDSNFGLIVQPIYHKAGNQEISSYNEGLDRKDIDIRRRESYNDERRESLLPLIEGTRQIGAIKRKLNQQSNIMHKIPQTKLLNEFTIRTNGYDHLKIKEKMIDPKSFYLKQNTKVETRNNELQVKENFSDIEREEFLVQMQQRLEKSKKRMQNNANKAKNNKKKRREKSADLGARTKVFLNKQNKVLFKEVFFEH